MPRLIDILEKFLKLLETIQGYLIRCRPSIFYYHTDACQTARGAILIFLLLQITNSITHIPGTLGVSTPLTDYVKFLPSHVPLPTFWSDPERSSLAGTSIEAALNAKLNSLDREFTFLRNATLSIEWCKHYWWDTETGSLSFEDWKQIDAIYRSRALDLPGTGHAMVPCVDMANHASGEDTVAVYETDVQGDAVLLLRDGKHLSVGDEITITYGDEKGACEMLFSYGFIAETMTSAQELFLDLVIPDDDPLKLAKNSVSKSAPGFRLFLRDGSVDWEGPFVWLLCVNEEDGLDFRLLQQTNGERELKVFWKDIEITDMSKICVLLKEERLWDLFDLRATATIQARVEMQLLALENSKFHLNNISDGGTCAQLQAIRLRDLEETLMLQAYQEFDEKVASPCL